VGGVSAFWAVYASSSSDQTLPSETVLEASRHPLPGGQAHVHRGAMVGLWWIFFSFLLSFLSSCLGFLASPYKKNVSCHFIFVSILILIVLITICFTFDAFWSFLFFNFIPWYFISFNFCIQFGSHSFYCYFSILFLIFF